MQEDKWSRSSRLGGLRRFAIAITILNILGHTLFGFEQSIAQPVVALATAYGLETVLELVGARIDGRAPNFFGGFRNLIDFLLSAHITALAIAMLIYTNDRLWPVVFATVVAIGSKALLRIRAGNSSRHFLNPSNFGITITLLAFPWVGIAPPYHFTENLDAKGDWILPGVIVLSGTLLNARFTKKLPLIAAWLVCFAAQATVRSMLFDTPIIASLMPYTGMAFILFTFYMVTDPATTPSEWRPQVLFGASVAAAYGLLLMEHAVFGLFFALTIVCLARGLILYVRALAMQKAVAKVGAEASAQVAAAVREV